LSLVLLLLHQTPTSLDLQIQESAGPMIEYNQGSLSHGIHLHMSFGALTNLARASDLRDDSTFLNQDMRMMDSIRA
jgi:hypothetical protein